MTLRSAAAAALAATTLALGAAPAAAGPFHVHEALELEKATTNIFKAYFPSAEIGRKAAITFHGQLLESHFNDGYLVLELDAADMDRLRLFGFRFEAALDFIQRRNRILTELQARQATGGRAGGVSTSGAAGGAPVGDAVTVQSIPSFACYETVEETFAAADAFVASRPALASFIDAGDSWQKTQGSGGYDIKVLRLTNSAVPGNKPKLFVNAAIHAREYATAPLVLEFARWLVNGHGVNADATWILDHHEVHLMLQTNPDGRKRAETGLSWRKNTNNAYCANTNTRGADLNRNFGFSWNSTAGQGSSGDPCNLTYRGASPSSEPETRAVEGYVRSLWPDRRGPLTTDAAPADTSGIHLDIHSYSQLVLWPWGTTSTPAPNGTALQTLGRKFAFFNGYTPQQSIGLYPTDGTSDSVSYGELGVAAYTFELGTAFFESCTNYNNVIKPNNLPALIYAAKVVRTPYITPGGPDVTTLGLSNDASGFGVLAGTPVTLTASATDARFNNSNGTEPTQAVAAAEAYIDVPPWDAGAVALPLAAADGSFNATTEGLAGTLATSGLAPGRHTVFVRARDAGGTWGAVSAVFLNIATTPPPLAAAFTASCNFLACSFNANASTGAITSYGWTFGDTTSGTGVATNHTYAAAGTFNVTLTVGDGTASATRTQAVTVSAAPVITPVAEVESNNTRGTAQLVSPNPARVSGTLASSADNDYFRIDVAAGRTLSASLAPNATSDYDLYLYNANGTQLAASTRGTGLVDSLTRANTGTTTATWYLRVRYFSGATGAAGTYTLDISR